MSSDAVDVIRLWDDGPPPTTIDDMPPEETYVATLGPHAGLTMVRNVSDPTLSVYTPAVSNGVGVIVCPGGGWTIHAWQHEGVDVAEWLTALGYTVFLLKYRVQASPEDQAGFEQRWTAGVGNAPIAISQTKKPRTIGKLIKTPEYLAARAAAADDGRRAISVVRDRFDLRSLGMLGFSAGAFLTVDVALDPRAEPLDFIAPIYGGEVAGAEIPADAPPMFTAVASDDFLSKIVEGMYDDWSIADRPAEIHVFRRGQHGFGMLKQGLPSDAWTDMFAAWVQDLS